MDLAEKINEILKDLSGMDDVASDSHLQDDLGLDSLHMVMLLMELEDCFGFTLDESDMNPFALNTATDIVALVKKYIGTADE